MCADASCTNETAATTVAAAEKRVILLGRVFLGALRYACEPRRREHGIFLKNSTLPPPTICVPQNAERLDTEKILKYSQQQQQSPRLYT